MLMNGKSCLISVSNDRVTDDTVLAELLGIAYPLSCDRFPVLLLKGLFSMNAFGPIALIMKQIKSFTTARMQPSRPTSNVDGGHKNTKLECFLFSTGLLMWLY